MKNLNVGTSANDGTGQTLRSAMIDVQSNFDELVATKANLVSGKLSKSELPGYVQVFSSTSSFPVIGLVEFLYLDSSANKLYYWNGSYNLVSGAVNSVNGYVGNVTLSKGDLGLGNVENTIDSNKSVYSAVRLTVGRYINGVYFDATSNIYINAVDLTARIPSTEKAQPNGVATLNGSGLVPATQLPSYVDDVLEFSSFSNFPASGETGKIYIAIDTNKTYRWSGSAYVYITSGAVDSVAGKTGVVSLVKADVGLGSVDNTSDAAKPISSATVNALNLKANQSLTISTTAPLSGGGNLSTNRTISISQATTSTNGFLTATDWNNFNNKQNAISNIITGTGTVNYLPKFTGTGTLGNSSIFDNGRVGIGTSTPDSISMLTIKPSITYPYPLSVLNRNGTQTWSIAVDANVIDDKCLSFVNNNIREVQMVLSESGNLGIGTTSPTQKLDVNGVVNTNNRYTLNDEIKTNQFFGGGVFFTSSNANNVGIRNDAGDILFAAGSASENMTIKANGNVGIGTISPSTTLEVAGTVTSSGVGNPSFRFNSSFADTNNRNWDLLSNVNAFGDFDLRVSTAQNLTPSVSVLKVKSSGNVGIGVTNPIYKLQVNGNIFADVSNGGGFFLNGNSGMLRQNNNELAIYSNSVERMRLLASGNVTIGSTTDNALGKLQVTGNITATGNVTATAFFASSDIRLKNIIEPTHKNVSGIKAITYTWKDTEKEQTPQFGYSAQDVKEVMPDAISTDNDGYLAVNYIHVLIAKVEELEREIMKLKQIK